MILNLELNVKYVTKTSHLYLVSTDFCSKECVGSIKGKELYMAYKSKIMTGYNNDVEYRNNIINKTKKTKLEKYGNENYNNMSKFLVTYSKKTEEEKQITKERRMSTNLKKFGHVNVFNTPAVKRKVKIIKRINSWNNFEKILSRKNIKYLFDYDYFINIDNNNYKNEN
jgi:hypothetical protein